MMETLRAVSPEILLLAWASCLYLSGAFVTWSGRRWCVLSLVGVALSGLTLFTCARQVHLGDAAVVATDPLSQFGAVLALVTGAAILLLSTRLPERDTGAEYFASLLLVIVGGMLVAAAQELVVLYLGLELISVPTYILLYVARQDVRGQEASAKYFFLSIFSSALFLYGLSFIYGAVGSTHFAALRAADPGIGSGSTLMIALTLIVVGLGFKLAAVPFHFYAPDVYQGTSNMTAAVLAWAPKAAGIFALLRLVVFALPTLAANAGWLFWGLAAVSMTLGNVMGLLQGNLRRLLAYSGIAHTGYLLIGIGVACVGSDRFLTGGAVESVAFYLLAYAAMTLGAFAVLAYLDNPARRVERIEHLAGLARSQPWVAAALATLLIGLTGIPLTAGFWGKLAVFASAVTCYDRSYLWLAIVGVINAAISAYYYLRIIGAMYMRDCEIPVQPGGGRGALAVAFLGAALTLVIGIFPGPFLQSVQGVNLASPPVPTAVAPAQPAERSS